MNDITLEIAPFDTAGALAAAAAADTAAAAANAATTNANTATTSANAAATSANAAASTAQTAATSANNAAATANTAATNANTATANANTATTSANNAAAAANTAATAANSAASAANAAAAAANALVAPLWLPNAPFASEKLLKMIVTQALRLPVNLAGSSLHADTAATAQYVLSVRKNGIEVGTITVAAAGTTGTFATAGGVAVDYAIGDRLEIVGAATVDATLRGIAISLMGSWI